MKRRLAIAGWIALSALVTAATADAQGGGTEAAGRKRQRYGSHRRRCGRWDGEWRRRSGWAGSNDIAARRDWSHDDDTECSAGGTAAKEACNFKPTKRPRLRRTASPS